ncbi:phosphotransferase [Streptomyces sp. NPDC004610]|uniref:phosphotransferase n=1 Tax=unclassified Streptomyces TaxID=2593676 RepID=UPI0033A35CB0
MSSEATSLAWLNAVGMSGDPNAVVGPLRGYHHETYVLPLPEGQGPLGAGRWKCREPRSGLMWFDRRCFRSEEQLLKGLAGRIDRIPDILDVGEFGLQRFVEGVTLGALYPSGQAVPDRLTGQVLELFEQLAGVTPRTLTVPRRCRRPDRPEDGDSAAFLERLITFAETHVHADNLPVFGQLFADLGLDGGAFVSLRAHVSGLKERPFCLLHADLHRENFIVDDQERLWTIDWELAMLGDPLYDLATHLYLMRYPPEQQERITKGWRETVERVRPGSAHGLAEDLPLLIDFKRAQSVFTDVIRVALSLDPGADPRGLRRVRAGWKLYKILLAAAEPLGLRSVPSPWRIVAALTKWRAARPA